MFHTNTPRVFHVETNVSTSFQRGIHEVAFVGFVPGCWLLLVTPVVTIYIWSVVIPRYRKNVGLWNFFCFTIFTRLFLSNRFIFCYWQYYTLRWICNKVFHEHVYYVFFSLATRFPYYIVAAFAFAFFSLATRFPYYIVAAFLHYFY